MKTRPVPKALILCSLSALFETAALELDACNAAFARHRTNRRWSAHDLGQVRAHGPLLGALDRLPRAADGPGLAETVLEELDAALDRAVPQLHAVTAEALAVARRTGSRVGLVSEMPRLTTNLARAAAMGVDASRIDAVELVDGRRMEAREGLAPLIERMGLRARDCRVIVSSAAEAEAAAALGADAVRVDDGTSTRRRIHLARKGAGAEQAFGRAALGIVPAPAEVAAAA